MKSNYKTKEETNLSYFIVDILIEEFDLENRMTELWICLERQGIYSNGKV